MRVDRMLGRVCILVAGLVALASCNGSSSGSSSGSFSDQARLLAVEFPDPQSVNGSEVGEPPQDAPLVQRVVLVFDEAPDPDQVSRLTVQIRDPQGVPARGRFEVEGSRVVFTPDLPLTAPRQLASGAFDGGGAGLDPGLLYSIRVGPGTWSFVGAVEEGLLAEFADPTDPAGVVLSIRTTEDPARFFRGLESRTPRLTAVAPSDGATNVTPELYSDPEGRFPTRSPFHLEFDAPLNPDPENLDFLLVDLEETSEDPAGLSLGVNARILENELTRSVVEVWPSGILPFGHLLSLEVPTPLASLSDLPPDAPGYSIAATFTTAPAPDEVRDGLVEDFTNRDRYDPDPELLDPGQIPASWNRMDSHVLTAAFAFDGAGELGRFAPAPPADGEDRIVILDTNYQVFPLLDGSTPDAPPGFVVRGGVFHFTSIDIPKNVEIEARGVNPLVLTATEAVDVSGRFDLRGSGGTPENAFDSAVTSIPGGNGGAGGGRGGESHPILFWPPDQFDRLTMVSPLRGGAGLGSHGRDRTGGEGGESGTLDHKKDGGYGTDQEISCRETNQGNDNGDQAAGGSGGSYLALGETGRFGVGNIRPDGRGGWTRLRSRTLHPGRPGLSPFGDADPNNDFFGVGGEVSELLGGQGGGAGGSRTESYYCGTWCRYDNISTNDQLCGAEFGDPPSFAGSVGDARGGSAGGGGGALMIQGLATINLRNSCRIRCSGGVGKGGEVTGNSKWGGPSGGGSGGAIVLQSAISIVVAAGAELDVTGRGALAPGGHGLIQLQPPLGIVADVRDEAAISPLEAWVDRLNVLNPARFTPQSSASSRWFDMGRTIARDPGGTNPVFTIEGLDADGLVVTDGDGNVVDPNGGIRCDYLGQLDPLNPGQYKEGQEPRADFIPTNASVRVQFQGAHAIAPGSKEVDSATVTPWLSDPAEVSAHQFLRYRVTFDIAARGRILRADAPRPSVQSVTIDSRF